MAIFDAVDIIRTKRDGGTLTPEQIDWTIDAYTSGVIKDEQMAALAMAIFLRGMNRAEIARWTDAMIRSGERMDFSGIGKPTADKHSTGGVGTRLRCPSPRSSPASGFPSPSCRAEAWGTRAVLWTNWSRFPVGGRS